MELNLKDKKKWDVACEILKRAGQVMSNEVDITKDNAENILRIFNHNVKMALGEIEKMYSITTERLCNIADIKNNELVGGIKIDIRDYEEKK